MEIGNDLCEYFGLTYNIYNKKWTELDLSLVVLANFLEYNDLIDYLLVGNKWKINKKLK